MSAELTRVIVVEAVLNDPYDGAVRLLGDTERFGFELQSFMLTAKSTGITAAITLHVPVSVEPHVVAARLSRHPTVQCVNVCADAGKVRHDHPQAAAA